MGDLWPIGVVVRGKRCISEGANESVQYHNGNYVESLIFIVHAHIYMFRFVAQFVCVWWAEINKHTHLYGCVCLLDGSIQIGTMFVDAVTADTE